MFDWCVSNGNLWLMWALVKAELHLLLCAASGSQLSSEVGSSFRVVRLPLTALHHITTILYHY